MTARLAVALGALVACMPALANTVILEEGFESYATQAALLNAWVPTIGDGSAAANSADVDSGYLIGCASCGSVIYPPNYPGIQGQAVDHIGATANTPGMVNQWGGVINQGTGRNPVFSIAPSAAQNVVLSYDLYDSGSGNERMSAGLRYINVVGTVVTTENIIEMGLFNSNSADPFQVGVTDPPRTAMLGSPGFYAGRGYGVQVQDFGARGSDNRGTLQVNPDWQYFADFDPVLDRTVDADEFVTIGDVGLGWHRYTVTISPTTVTFTIDLFRDGRKNSSKDPVTPGGNDRPGVPGVDAKLIFPISPTTNGFNSLRIGGPSGFLSAGAGFNAFDNIKLELVESSPPEPDADFDGDGDVDGDDLTRWRAGYGNSTLHSEGDADGDDDVDGLDFLVWQREFGLAPEIGVVNVPEVDGVSAALAASASFLIQRRRGAGALRRLSEPGLEQPAKKRLFPVGPG